MKATLRVRLGLLAAVTVVSACGGSRDATLPQSVLAQSRAHRASSSSNSLLYVVTSKKTFILTYPGGDNVASIPAYLGIACPDPVNGNIYFDSGGIFEYPFGGTKPIAHIYGTVSTGSLGCAVDPTTGNLATTWGVTGSDGKGDGWVAIYADPSSNPETYKIPGMGTYYYCGYDNQGNLFVDGYAEEGGSLLADLPKGAQEFTTITLDKKIYAGLIQWDGSYITIEDSTPPIIYRISISGASGTIVGTTKLRAQHRKKRTPRALTWIEGDTVLAPQGGFNNPNLGFWRYPHGGHPYRIIRGLATQKHDEVIDAAVDTKPSP